VVHRPSTVQQVRSDVVVSYTGCGFAHSVWHIVFLIYEGWRSVPFSGDVTGTVASGCTDGAGGK
jgi:hypothetical protein